MNHPLLRLILLATLLVLGATACKPKKPHTPQPSSRKPSAQSPALQFRKVTVGLPSHFMAVVGKDDYGIAGAADANKVFYAVRGEKGYEIHTSDLTNNQSAKVTDSNDLVTRSLTTDTNGKRLVYSRMRGIESYVDNPLITEPPRVTVIYSYDVAKGEESPVFDFKAGDWLRYRSATLAPMLSTSGKRVAALSFDVDRDLLMRDLDEWLSLAPNVVRGKGKEADRHKNEERLHQIFALPHIFPLLKDAGIIASDKAKFTQADIDAVRKLRQSHMAPQWAVLLSDGAEPKLVQVKVPAKYNLNPLSLMAVGDDTVVLATQGKSTTGYPEVQLLLLDEATGNATEFSSFVGAPQTVLLDSDEQNVLITYLAFDPKTKILANNLTLRTVPLDDAAGVKDAALYPAVPDSFATTSDPLTFAIQSAVDHTIYFSKAGSSPEKIAEMLSPVDGMFLTTDARHLAYAENGLLFSVDVAPGAEQSAKWVTANTFSTYETEAKAFLTKLGYEVPADLTFKWEEREGFGQHEMTAVAVKHGQDAAGGVLLRYSVMEKRFESLFFPGTPWPNASLPKSSVDAPGAEKRAQTMRTRVGWLSDKAQKYQPGANPLYDGNTGTYVLVFHDAYLLETPQGQKEAVNGEVTIRIHKPTGQLVEMSLQTMPEIKNANFKAGDEEILFAVRNKGREKYPENAPLRIDAKNASLVVARDKEPQFGPAEIEVLGDWRLAWAVDSFILPEDELIFTSWVDVETTDILGQLYFMPTNTARQGL